MTSPHEIDAQYDAWIAEQEKLCRSVVTLGHNDPTDLSCELEAGHTGQHFCTNPFGPDTGTAYWTGGGYCAGDPLKAKVTLIMPEDQLELIERPTKEN